MPTPPDFTAYTSLAAASLNKVGLWLVKTQAVGSGVSSVTVSSCFSADYDNYLVTVDNVDCSATDILTYFCLLYTSPSPRDRQKSRMPSSA